MLGRSAKSALMVVLMLLAGTAIAAKGKLGFSVSADTSGLLSPVIEHLTVATVRAGSPAARAGLKPNDEITEINGRSVSGEPAREMAGEFKNLNVGQKLILKVKRGTLTLSIEIVAA